MKFYCPNCNTPYNIEGATEGRKAFCQNCNTKFYITDKIPTAVVNALHGQEKSRNRPPSSANKALNLALAGFVTLIAVIITILLYLKLT